MALLELMLSLSRPGPAVLLTGAVVLGVAAITDIRSGRIPNRLLAFALVPGGILPFFDDSASPWHAFGAASAALFVVLLVRRLGRLLFDRPGMGLGDAKLAFVLGLFFQWHVVPIFYGAACLGAVFGATGIMLNRMNRASRMPFAPFLLAAATVYLVLTNG